MAVFLKAFAKAFQAAADGLLAEAEAEPCLFLAEAVEEEAEEMLVLGWRRCPAGPVGEPWPKRPGGPPRCGSGAVA
jgi:hypothetical protein